MEPSEAALVDLAGRLPGRPGGGRGADSARPAARRRVLGITGPPGAAKSTRAERVVAALGPDVARLVGMDGFHYAQAELVRLGRADRKGAPDTFDADGF